MTFVSILIIKYQCIGFYQWDMTYIIIVCLSILSKVNGKMVKMVQGKAKDGIKWEEKRVSKGKMVKERWYKGGK